jgi:hypothetical protein
VITDVPEILPGTLPFRAVRSDGHGEASEATRRRNNQTTSYEYLKTTVLTKSFPGQYYTVQKGRVSMQRIAVLVLLLGLTGCACPAPRTLTVENIHFHGVQVAVPPK